MSFQAPAIRCVMATCLLVAMAALSLSTSTSLADNATGFSEPAIPGLDTTRITSPLDADGHIDFAAVVEARRPKPKTRKDNGLYDLARAIGPELIIEAHRDTILGWMNLPTDGPYLTVQPTGDEFYEQINTAQEGPFAPGSLPVVEAWIKANTKPLTHLRAAASRPVLYWPRLTDPKWTDQAPLRSGMNPNLSKLRKASQLLIVSVNAHFGAGRFDQGLANLTASLWFSRHMMLEGDLLSYLVAQGIQSKLLLAISGGAEKACFSEDQAKALLAKLETIPDGRALAADSLDNKDRLTELSSFYRCHADRTRLTALDVVMMVVAQGTIEWGFPAMIESTDPNQAIMDQVQATLRNNGAVGRSIWNAALPQLKALAAANTSSNVGKLLGAGPLGRIQNPAGDEAAIRVDQVNPKRISWPHAMKAVNEFYDQLVEAMRLPWPKSKTRLTASSRVQEEWKAQTINRLGALVVGPEPTDPKILGTRFGQSYVCVNAKGLAHLSKMIARYEALLARTKVLLRLSAYHDRHGRWPDKLDDLNAAGGPAPLSPWTGKPFEYRRDGDTFHLEDNHLIKS